MWLWPIGELVLIARPGLAQGVERSMEQKIEADRLLEQGETELFKLDQYQAALQSLQQALKIYREIKDKQGEGLTLNNLGRLYERLGSYNQAIEAYSKYVQIARDIKSKKDEFRALEGLGTAYFSLGNYQKELETSERALVIAREMKDRELEMGALYILGLTYRGRNYKKSVEYHEKALSIAREIKDRRQEGRILGSLGWVYQSGGNNLKAIEFYEQHLTITRELGDRIGEGHTLRGLGLTYEAIGNYKKALKYYEQRLVIARRSKNLEDERLALFSLGSALEKQDLTLAILFYKHSVNLIESIRQNSRELDKNLQESYTKRVSPTYRILADLLLQQDRILEAQRVLDLLKVQELDNYLQGVQRNSDTETGIPLRPQEQTLLDRFNNNQTQLIALGNELDSLEAIATEDRTQPQKDRIRELRKLQAASLQSITTFFESDEIQAIIAQLRTTTGAANLEISQLQDLRQNLANLNQNAVLLYPLILDDRLELILVTPNSPPIRRTVNVKRQDLNRAIANYRSALRSPSDIAGTKQLAQQLYSWLIEPIEADLAQAKAESPDQTLLYAPDGALRYIPLAALHDGDQWLAERLQINNITAASIDDLGNAPPSGDISILAAAFSEGQHQVDVSNRTLSFPGLPFAGREVENLAKLNPKTETRFNENFNADIVYDMNDYNIVHLATHATFASGTPEDSFILFGDGSRANLNALKSWNIPKVDLIVLSACETAVGDELGSGEEILGFGYLMQQAGADAAIASLWQVSDGGTQSLMDAFYAALRQGHTKAKALQLAQQALISSDYSAVGLDRAGIQLAGGGSRNGLDNSQLNHPYYWAPFILIGNGL